MRAVMRGWDRGPALSQTKSAAVFITDLNALGTQRMEQAGSPVATQAAVGLQAIWSFTNDPGNRKQGPST